MPTPVFDSSADYFLYWSLMIHVSRHLAGVARELTAFYTMRKSVACSVIYPASGAGRHYAFSNTFLTESILYTCVCDSISGYTNYILKGILLNFMSDVRQTIAGNAFEFHQKRGVIRI